MKANRTITITVSLPDSEVRRLAGFTLSIQSDADIHDMFEEVIDPMLITLGFHPKSIVAGCASYISKHEVADQK